MLEEVEACVRLLACEWRKGGPPIAIPGPLDIGGGGRCCDDREEPGMGMPP